MWTFGLLGAAGGLALPTVSGGTLTSDATYNYHTFTSSGTLSISGGSVLMELLCVAGGGGTGSATSNGSGGGGAGGQLYLSNQTLATGSHAVVIGAGGNQASYGPPNYTTRGNDSYVGSLSRAIGGGAGMVYAFQAGGGSAGGVRDDSGGTGTAGQGNNSGGAGSTATSGGGGAGGASSYKGYGPGAGGIGSSAYSSTFLMPANAGELVSGVRYIAAGGNGGFIGGTEGEARLARPGGGGLGAIPSASATAGMQNTGSGGGGSMTGSQAGAPGGSGIVIIKYPKSLAVAA